MGAAYPGVGAAAQTKNASGPGVFLIVENFALN
jgi:hypothetical protein